MPSRLILRGGEDLLSSWPVALALEKVAEGERSASMTPGYMLDVPLVQFDVGPPRMAFVRPAAIDALEPLDEREMAAHGRDREEWIEHGE